MDIAVLLQLLLNRNRKLVLVSSGRGVLYLDKVLSHPLINRLYTVFRCGLLYFMLLLFSSRYNLDVLLLVSKCSRLLFDITISSIEVSKKKLQLCISSSCRVYNITCIHSDVTPFSKVKRLCFFPESFGVCSAVFSAEELPEKQKRIGRAAV